MLLVANWFIGANLLHVATSAFVGIILSLCFFHKHKKGWNILGGLFIASTLHFFFNYLIIKGPGNMDALETAKVMLPLWVVLVIVIFILEKVKQIKEFKNKIPK